MNLIASSLAAAALATILTWNADAGAQRPAQRPTAPTTKTADYTEQNLDGDQIVKFTGDELEGPPGGAYGDVVRRPPGVTRAGLIRPRMNFVSELLKSVENL